MEKFKKISKVASTFLLYVFAVIGFIFTAVFVAMQFGLLNVRGSSMERNKFFTDAYNESRNSKEVENVNIKNINKSWAQTQEWQVLKAALIKDKDVILRASNETGISPRAIIGAVIAEQFRFFASDRESYKKYFEPLKILGVESQFSLGVAGVKEETAKDIETYLYDTNSAFYAGKDLENLIIHQNANHSQERYVWLTDDKNHYYSYLYTGLFMRQVIAQWQKDGIDIQNKPEILATLFNIGFKNSIPKKDPLPGGSNITLGGYTYTFGELAGAFYYSSELLDVFPR